MKWPWARSARKSLGQRGEEAAAAYLRRLGFRFLERNAKLGRYEIDIIARDADTVVFVEVKTREQDDFALPEVNVTSSKQHKIRVAARRYIDGIGESDLYFRFDVVTVVIPANGEARVAHIPNAFGG